MIPARWILLAGLVAQAPTDLPSHPRELRPPPLQPFVPPQPVSLRLEGGAELLVIENELLPLVDGTLIFRGGHREEKPELAGLTTLLADVLREGGSTRTGGQALDDWLDTHAASIIVRSTPNALRIDFACVKDDLGTVLVFIGELLMMPAYAPVEIEKCRTRLLSQLARDAQNPALFADHLLDRVTFGATSSRHIIPTGDTLARITREALLEHHHRMIGADRLLVGVTGSVNPSSLAARLDSLLSSLPNVGSVPESAPTVFHVPGRRTIYVHDRPDASHCEIRMAGPGVRRLDPDYVPLSLWSYANGFGGSSNRLMVRLRAELGLIFEGSLYFEPDWDRAGRLVGACSTRTEGVGEVISACLDLLRVAKDPLPEGELEAARQRMINAEVFKIDSPEEVLERALTLRFQGYPADFWARRAEQLLALDAEITAQAVRRHLEVERLTVVVVGPLETLREVLTPLGTVVALE